MTEEAENKSRKADGGGVTLTQMLKVLDKDVATGIEKKLKKLSKKKAIEKPLEDHKAAQIQRVEAYSQATKEVSKWDPIVERNRKAKNLKFPLDIGPEILPTSADCIDGIKPRNDLEREVQKIIDEEKAARSKEMELTKSEQQYQKAISAEEAKERHKELQRMRVKLGSFAAKMRRQKGIKSKSYHKILKHERIRKHVKKVESDQDALLEEIEKLQKLRAKERATLKHKNTGKWAKHAKFRLKYDDEARRAMLDQIGIANKLLEKPALQDSDEDESDFGDNNDTEDDEEDEISDVSSEDDEGNEETTQDDKKNDEVETTADRLIVSTELLDDKMSSKRKKLADDEIDSNDENDEDDGDDDDEQRRLMSEAFANDDVVSQFKEAKDKVADEEQPKDINTFLPGWGDWAGPGITISKRQTKRFIIKAKKIKRKDATLGNVIISENANNAIKELQPKSLPRGIKNDDRLKEIVTDPVTATFINQTAHREKVRPQIETRMGRRIEPISQRMLADGARAEWS